MIILTLLLGLVLRLWQIGLPDLATDEAQFILGASAAHPPLGILLFQGALALHHSVTAARMVSVLAGFLCVGALFLLAQRFSTVRTAGFVAATASVFPGHMIFSKLAYLDGLQTLAWVLTILTLEQARSKRKEEGGMALLLLWAAAVASTFIKTQGFLLPLALLLLRLWEMRAHRPWRDPIAGMLILSLLPIALYLPTHPGIFATLQLYGGSTFGLEDFLTRIVTLLGTWWHELLLLLPLAVLSLPSLRKLPLSIKVLCVIAAMQGVLLGPGHAYYVTELVIFALPIGLFIARLPRTPRVITLILCMGSALAVQMRASPTYWNTHADTLNALLAGEERIVAVGPTGHHVRWYLQPEVLVGDTMDLAHWNGFILDLGTDRSLPEQTVLYQDERLRLLHTR